MISIKLLESTVGLLLLVFFITQMIIPAYKGRKMFPLFRKKEKELEDQLIDATEERDQTDIRDKIKDIREDTKLTSFQRKKNRDFKKDRWTK
jgi:uncharacterized membrane protein YgaE (UPF0421/DUF939 family)